MPNEPALSARSYDVRSAVNWRAWVRQHEPRLRSWFGWLALCGFLTLGFFIASSDYNRKVNSGTPGWIVFLVSASAVLTQIWMWGITWKVISRYPIRRGQVLKALGLQALGLGAGLAPLAVLAAIVDTAGLTFAPQIFSTAHAIANQTYLYLGATAVMHGLVYARTMRRAEESALRLKAELSEAAKRRMEAELRALKSELSPRFLVDALETVSALIAAAPAKAEQSLAQLGDVVRSALHRGSTREVSLQEELEGMKPFLDLERSRLGGRLDVDVETDEAVLTALVPDLVLQPLVSAVLKGHRAGDSQPRLAIAVRRAATGGDAGVLEIILEGSGIHSTGTEAPDFAGPANIQSRLAELYGKEVQLQFSADPGAARRIRLALPWHETELRTDEPRSAPTQPAEGGGVTRRWPRPTMKTLGLVACLAYWWAFLTITDVMIKRLRFPDGAVLPEWFIVMNRSLGVLVGTIMVYAAIEMSRRYPWEDRATSKGRAILAHVRVGLALSVLHVAQKASVSLPYGTVKDTSASHIAALAAGTTLSTVFWYGAFVMLAYAVSGVRRRHRAEREALRTQAEMSDTLRRRAEAELRALQAELNPHFLGNALHTVAGLVGPAPDEARRLLRQLQLFMRAPMTRSATPEVSLAEELALLEPYLAVESARLRRPLAVRWRVDSDVLRGRVPQMILQPLVENAVKHGLSRQTDRETGGIEVAARRAGAHLEITVSNEGAGLEQNGAAAPRRDPRDPRVGVSNTRARLHELYGSQASFELVSRVEGGTTARISVPWRDQPAVRAAATPSFGIGEAVTLA